MSSARTRRTLFGLVKVDDYLVEKPCGFQTVVDGNIIQPQITQPYASGAEIIAKHYFNKYGVQIVIVDHSKIVENGDNLLKRFQAFCTDTLPHYSLNNNSAIGFVLMHDTNHAVPVLISCENDKNYMVVFDSTSGPRRKGYIAIANLVPHFKVLLNDGTRQADNGSCVTDALSILKDALRITQLATNIEAHKSVSIDTLTPSPERQNSFAAARLNQPNLGLFNMPEPLLKTAQISNYVIKADANLDTVIRSPNKPLTDDQGNVKPATLRQRRAADELTVSFNRKPEQSVGINSYLFNKSRKHAAIIKAEVDRLNRASK